LRIGTGFTENAVMALIAWVLWQVTFLFKDSSYIFSGSHLQRFIKEKCWFKWA